MNLNILVVDASVRSTSRCHLIAKSLVEECARVRGVQIDWLALNDQDDWVRIDADVLVIRESLEAGDPLPPLVEQSVAWQAILNRIDRLQRADVVVVTTPKWNFSVPSPLKNWIDCVLQPTMTYEPGIWQDGGLLKNKIAGIILTAGGNVDADSDPAISLVRDALTTMGIVVKEVVAKGLAKPTDSSELEGQNLANVLLSALNPR